MAAAVGSGPGATSAQLAWIALVAVALALLAAVGLPLWRPLLVAAVLMATFSRWYERFASRLGGRRSLAALLFTVGTVVLVLAPLAGVVLVAVHEAAGAASAVRHTLESGGVNGLIGWAPNPLRSWLQAAQRYLPPEIEGLRSEISTGGRWALATLTGTVGAVAHTMFQLFMMLIALFFLLRDGPALGDWLVRATPLPPARVRELMEEFRTVARSVVGANIITGAAQSVVATAGYFILRAPSPIFFGLLTLMASLLPPLGTALVTFPVAAILLLIGRPWAALVMALWAALVVGLIDNLLRPILIKRRSGNRSEGGSGSAASLHGALVFFSLVGGIASFGAVGVFLGPLALTFFLTTVRIARRGPVVAPSG